MAPFDLQSLDAAWPEPRPRGLGHGVRLCSWFLAWDEKPKTKSDPREGPVGTEVRFQREILHGGVAWMRSPRGICFPFLLQFPTLAAVMDVSIPLSAILALVCCAMLCGARSYAAIGQWAQDQDITLMHRLGFARRPPKAGGIRKVLIALNAKAFEHALTQ